MKKVLLLLIFVLVGLMGFGQTATTRVTVITHGFTPGGKLDNDWKKFALRLRKRTGGTVFFNGRDGNWYILGKIKEGNETLYNGTDQPNEHKIFLFDWAYPSIKPRDGNLEASADYLFALLCKTPIGNIFEESWDTHFIGHSRGNMGWFIFGLHFLRVFVVKCLHYFTIFLKPLRFKISGKFIF